MKMPRQFLWLGDEATNSWNETKKKEKKEKTMNKT